MIIQSQIAMDKKPAMFVRGKGRAIAFDYARSMRSTDVDGRLHVATTNISKANVCEYNGSEIPDYDKLGLDPSKVYRLYRDPSELKKAAPTFNNLPLLIKHVPVSADDHQPDLVIGSTGTDAKFSPPYLTNSLVIWAQNAIDLVESDKQKELSSAYRYRADMTPGTSPDGEAYDGVMRDIIGNHVALVEEGRAGPDVVVMDAKPTTHTKKEITMSALSRKALYTGGALSAYLRPRMAADAKLDLNPIVKDVTATSFDTAKIEAAIRASGVLAQDADLKDMTDFINHLKDQNIPETDPAPAKDSATDPDMTDPATDPNMDPAATDAAKKKAAHDAACASFRDGLADDAQRAAFDALFNDHDEDNTPEAKQRAEVTPAAMDAAIKKSNDELRKQFVAASEAREFVAPWVGKLSMALDSAEAIYKTALEAVGVSTKDLHSSAYKSVLSVQPKPGSGHATVIAQDGAVDATGFESRYGDAGRIKIA